MKRERRHRRVPPIAALRRALRWALSWALFWTMTGGGLPAWAVEIRVRARSSLELAADTAGPAIVLRGKLADDAARPIPRADIAVELGGEREERHRTDDAGAIRWTVSKAQAARMVGGDEKLTVQASYAGDSRYAGTQASLSVDLARSSIELRLILLAPKLDASAPSVGLIAEASGPEPIPQLPLSVGLEVPGGAPARLTLETDARGQAVAELPLPSPLAPGRYEVVAISEESAAFAHARASAALLLTAPAELAFEVEPASRGGEPAVRFTGRLQSRTAPLPHAAVSILVDGQAVGAAATDAQGAFDTTLPVERLAVPRTRRTAVAQAVFEPPVEWLLPALSPTVPFRVPTASPVPWTPYLVGAAAAAALLLLGWAHRRGLLQVRLRRAAARTPGAVAPADMAVPSMDVEPGAPHAGLGGVVLDPLVDRGVAGAKLWLVPAALASPSPAEAAAEARAPHVEATSDDRGRFAFPPVPAGAYRLQVRADGYVPAQLDAVVGPSPGLGLRIALPPWRLLARDRFRSALAPPFAGSFPWGKLTPSQAQYRLMQGRSPDLLAIRALVKEFERVYFGPAPATEQDVHRIESLASRALEPRAPRVPPSGQGDPP